MISFVGADFTRTPVFSNVLVFSFTIDIGWPLVAGAAYNDPTLNSVNYNVSGSLAATPSGFPAFALSRSISGTDFYAQGSSLSFETAAGADLTDGLQVSDLVGDFVFNGREVGTGRYHPALLELSSAGTGTIRNSNNFGGVNPSSLEVVDVEIGEEYVTNLSFDAGLLTLADAVPLPPLGLPLVLVGFLGLVAIRRRATR